MKHTKIFLTSIIAMCVAVPAFATPTNTGAFPNNGLMQPDYTYTNAATSTNMDGVYEGDVDAVPQYTDDEYTVTAGNYLPAAAEALATCTAGNFCPGLQNTVHYHATNNQGLNECPSGYGNSAEGASANTDCYRACAIANNGTTFTNIPHATAVSGNDYYNTTATDTCEPTACENGWHVKAAVVAPNLTSLIGVSEGTGYTSNNYMGDDSNTDGMSNTILANDPMAFAVDYGNGKGVIKGHGRCSKTGVTTPWYDTQGYTFAADHFVNNLTNETDPETGGRNCYCQLDSYTASGSNTSIALSAPWVFNYDLDDAAPCAYDCAYNCANYLRLDDADLLAFRAAVFASLASSPASCEANTITINWTGTTQAAIDANEAGTATYGGNIRTPQSASHVPGKTFTGWLFSAPSGE